MERYSRIFLAMSTFVLVLMSGCTTNNNELDLTRSVSTPSVKVKFSTSSIVTALKSPLYDLNLLRYKIPDVLPESDELYTLPVTMNCATLQTEIEELSNVLGEDPAFHGVHIHGANHLLTVDVDQEISDSFSALVPYRDYLRRLSGAKKRAQYHKAAIFRGHLQRAHLHGKAAQLQCLVSQAQTRDMPLVLVEDDIAYDFKATRKPIPAYPTACVKHHIRTETASVRYDITPDGRTQNVTITASTNNCFNKATANAIKNWHYEPVILDGQARHVMANTVTVAFLPASDRPIFASYVHKYTSDTMAAASPHGVSTTRNAPPEQANDGFKASPPPPARQILAKRFSVKIIPLPRTKPETLSDIVGPGMQAEYTHTGQAITMKTSHQNTDVSRGVNASPAIYATRGRIISNRYRIRPVADASRYRPIHLSAL